MCMHPDARRYRMAGISLVELVVFIIVVAVGIGGILPVFGTGVKGSVDPMQRKQAIAIAESLLSEIEQQPFTYCDPQDNFALTASSTAGCNLAANNQEVTLGPTPAGETRDSGATQFDNVGDYNGFTMPNGTCAGICQIGSNTPIPGLNAYRVTVTITTAGSAFTNVPQNAALRIRVRVTGPGSTDVSVTGYRFRYAPNALG